MAAHFPVALAADDTWGSTLTKCPTSPLDVRVDEAFTPSDRDNTHLAALDIREPFETQPRRLVSG